MSGGRFLVSWRDVNQSETILKLRTLIKTDCNLEDCFSVVSELQKKEALQHIDEKLLLVKVESLTLSSDSREVSNMVAGYVARKARPLVADCCAGRLEGACQDDSYIQDDSFYQEEAF